MLVVGMVEHGGVGLYEEVLGFETAWEVPGRGAGTPNMVEWVKNWYYFVHLWFCFLFNIIGWTLVVCSCRRGFV